MRRGESRWSVDIYVDIYSDIGQGLPHFESGYGA